jgi:pimeloyl-ACP methyl ester carboxylesterase
MERVASAERTTTEEASPRPVREELRRIARDASYVWRLAAGRVALPAATPADGPDPYGDPDPEWLRIDWGEHRREIEVVGARVNYVEMGQGAPIIFVHGLSGAWQNWLENIPHFARTRRVIVPDLPGFGHSPMPAEKISISNYAEIVDELLDQLGIEKAAVVGNSMGGFIGAEMAIELSTRVEELVLVSAAGLTTQELHRDTGMALLRRIENILAFGSGWVASRSELVTTRPRLRKVLMAFVAAHPDQLPGPLTAEQVRGSGKPGFLDALEALGTYPLEDRLEQIECPTLVIWGDKDRLVPVRDADRFVKTIGPNSRKLVYKDTGHVAMFERPARFNADVEAFLAEDRS